MRSNQRVKLLEPNCDDDKEVKRDNLKVEVMNVYDSYIKQYCDHNGEIKLYNTKMKTNPIKVLNGIKSKVVDQKLVAVTTDKTNRLSFMSSASYKESMEEHHRGDKSITKKELNKVEKELGRHLKSVVKIFRVGYKHGQKKRALGNATVHHNG